MIATMFIIAHCWQGKDAKNSSNVLNDVNGGYATIHEDSSNNNVQKVVDATCGVDASVYVCM